MEFFVQSYAAGADPRLSPLTADDLAGLPTATVITAEATPCGRGLRAGQIAKRISTRLPSTGAARVKPHARKVLSKPT
jgi:acetyl esterase/lipase